MLIIYLQYRANSDQTFIMSKYCELLLDRKLCRPQNSVKTQEWTTIKAKIVPKKNSQNMTKLAKSEPPGQWSQR